MKKLLSFLLILSFAATLLLPVNIYAEEAILISSYSFEEDFEGWEKYVANDPAVIRTDEKFYEGSFSIFIEDNSQTATSGISSPFIDVTPGELYTFSSYIYVKNGSSVRLYVKFYDKADKVLQNTSKTVNGTSFWQLIYDIHTAPEGAVKARMQLVGTSSDTGSAYVDNSAMYKGIKKFPKTEPPYVTPVQAEPVNASIIAPVNDKLFYKAYNEEGDKLSDFSYAGYYAGDIELPETKDLPVVSEISPTGTEDDTSHIQAAIDKAFNTEGDLKVVKLKAGKYRLPDPIYIKSGVLLSGEGQGPNGTVLFASKPSQYSPVHIEGAEPNDDTTKKYYLTDDYVKSGSKTVHVSMEDALDLKVGDEIAIYYTVTDEWCEAMDMVGVINVYDNDTGWKSGDVSMVTERKITAVNGNEITVDFGFFVPYITELTPTYFVKTSDEKRVENAGVENLRIESFYNGSPTDEEHATIAITIRYAKNIFVRDITSKYFYFGAVQANKRTKQITVRNCSCLDPVSTVAGSRRYSFHASYSAQQILYTGCYSYDGRHDFATSREVTGPVAFVDNVADSSNTSSETHGTWSTGVLYDNLYQIKNFTKGFIANANRGIYGTAVSQGWTSAGCVIWNSLAPAIISHKPPLTYQNFIIGNWGTYTDESGMAMKKTDISAYSKAYRTGSSTLPKEGSFATSANTSFIGDSYKESVTAPVNPRSLYKAQLSERYTGTIKNARPNSPVIAYPYPDKISDENEIEITGFFEKGASGVYVYIDNIPYEAELDSKDNSFKLVKSLEDGTHKIYATQVIDGAEGNKTADRFITVKEEKGNPDYLQSIYPAEKTSMLLNDSRPGFSEYMEFDKVVLPEENEMPLAVMYSSVPEGEYIKVKNQTGYIAIRGDYLVIAAKTPVIPCYTPLEYGIVLSDENSNPTSEDCDERIVSKIKLTDSGAYGILIYNIKRDTVYTVRSYVIYKDILNKEHILYGKSQTININD
ncbi:MAG: hypothetical protein E7411_00790 [Ruminococcaceae bacterium]|nr:hypothetical protein [Oscillospiraceae bacterium]